MVLKTEFLVIGSSFSGSLAALCLNRIGRDVVLVDRGAHPRFAIGESSTPLADLQLLRLADEYRLPRLAPLTTYGSWKSTYPQIACGLKRGFSYFQHRPDHDFQTDEQHSTDLIVAASPNDAVGDTHWLRADVDAFLAAEAVGEGIPLLERTVLTCKSRSPWVWTGIRDDQEPIEIHADFVIDASGTGGVIPRALGGQDLGRELITNSRSIFCHVRELLPWHDLLNQRGIATDTHPYRCDRAAVHHLLDEGWMWQLPFDHGVTSVGFVLEGAGPGLPAPAEWSRLLARYPALQDQFRDARIVAPITGLQATSRLQRQWSRIADVDYLLLPSTAGFIDPMHSTGIAHSLFGVADIVKLVADTWGRPAFVQGLLDYEERVTRELRTIDRLIAACYATRGNMDLFEAAACLYFVAAIQTEERLQAGMSPRFLSLDRESLQEILWRQSDALIASRAAGADVDRLVGQVRQAIAPWNTAGLLDPGTRRMYRYTAANKSQGVKSWREPS